MNLVGNRPTRERVKGNVPIKGGDVQHERGFIKIKREDLEKSKKEKVVIAE